VKYYCINAFSNENGHSVPRFGE